jgi:hypothetical protein
MHPCKVEVMGENRSKRLAEFLRKNEFRMSYKGRIEVEKSTRFIFWL